MSRNESRGLRNHIRHDDIERSVAILQGTEDLAATKYIVKISMDKDSADALQAAGNSLYAFKAVKSSTPGGKPTVWFQTQKYSVTTNISWFVQYQAYTSMTDLQVGVTIDTFFGADIDLGQTLNVTGNAGTGEVTTSGKAGQISIFNKTTTPFTCGLTQSVNGAPGQPMCAFPLPGTNTDMIVPIQKVLLMFATEQVDTGTVIERSNSQGVLIDLTGATDNTRNVTFKVNKGWEWGGGTWATTVDSNENLVPLLITKG